MKNILRDAYLFIASMFVYGVGRLALYAVFAPPDARPSFDWLAMSFRFDMLVSAFIVLPAFVLTIISAYTRFQFDGIKKAYANAAIFVSVVIASLNVGFFSEYHSQYNYWIQGLFFDDLSAIGATIWKEYNIPAIAIGLVAALALIVFVTGRVFKLTQGVETPKIFNRLPVRIAATLIAVFVLVVAVRGGRLSGRPLQMRDIVVCNNDFMNNIVPSSAFCLKNELKKCIEIQFDFTKVNEGELRNYAKEIYGSDGGGNMVAALRKTAKGSPLKAMPSHVFFIVCESLSAWPTFEQFQKYNLMPEIGKLAEKGIYSNSMLTVSNGTMATMSSVISGIPFAGIGNQGLYKSEKEGFGIARYMKELGYEPVFMYAGQMSWHGIGEFAQRNGFEEVIGGEKMNSDFGHVEWGIRDDELLEFIVNKPYDKPSFNLILTVSNHPPYDIDLKKFGCPNDISGDAQKRINHMWYSDSQIAAFIRRITARFPDAIVVVTGDHPSRVFPENEEISAECKMLVPLLITGNPIEDADLAGRRVGGVHMDILPTIIELVAPKGFEYSSWGVSVLNENDFVPTNTAAIYKNGRVLLKDSSGFSGEDAERIRKFTELAYWSARNGLALPEAKK